MRNVFWKIKKRDREEKEALDTREGTPSKREREIYLGKNEEELIVARKRT